MIRRRLRSVAPSPILQDMAGSPFDISALYRAPVTVCSSQGIGRYRANLASRDRLVLDLDDVPERAVRPEVGDHVSVCCADTSGRLDGDERGIGQIGRSA